MLFGELRGFSCYDGPPHLVSGGGVCRTSHITIVPATIDVTIAATIEKIERRAVAGPLQGNIHRYWIVTTAVLIVITIVLLPITGAEAKRREKAQWVRILSAGQSRF